VIGQRLGKIVAQVPADAQALGSNLHQPAHGAQILEKEDELELEQDHRVDRGPPARSIAVPDQSAHEREVDSSLQTTIEVVFRDELFEGEVLYGVRNCAPWWPS
jgi:hypothetical protein